MNPVNRFQLESPAAQELAHLSDTDLAARARVMDVELSGSTLLIPFFGRRHRVSAEGVTDAVGNSPTPAVAHLLLDYALHCPIRVPEAGTWLAGQLVGTGIG